MSPYVDLVPGYLDIVPNPSGYRHIALFSPVDAPEPIFLTEGDWEVAGGIASVDINRRLMQVCWQRPRSTPRLTLL